MNFEALLEAGQARAISEGVSPMEIDLAKRNFAAALAAKNGAEARRIAQSDPFTFVLANEAIAMAREWPAGDAQLRTLVARELVTLRHAVQLLRADLHEANAKLAKAEASPLKYMATFTEGMDYSKGNFVTYQGSLWHCNTATRERPGTGYDWTLAVKRGSDGRDAR